MIGSPLVGWWIAHTAFWILLGLAARDRRWRLIGVFTVLWVICYIATRQITTLSLYFMSYVAVLDIALVFIVLKRDIRLT